MKKIISLFICVAMCLSLSLPMSFAETNYDEQSSERVDVIEGTTKDGTPIIIYNHTTSSAESKSSSKATAKSTTKGSILKKALFAFGGLFVLKVSGLGWLSKCSGFLFDGSINLSKKVIKEGFDLIGLSNLLAKITSGQGNEDKNTEFLNTAKEYLKKNSQRAIDWSKDTFKNYLTLSRLTF